MPFYTVQHKRSDEVQRRPTPDELADGQVAINYNILSPGLFFKTDDGDIIKVGPDINVMGCGARCGRPRHEHQVIINLTLQQGAQAH